MLQVRDVPDEVHTRLRARAARAGMSLSEFALQELTRVAQRPSLAELFERISSGTGPDLSFDDARAAVLADRPAE